MKQNVASADLISTESRRVSVRVIHTDEEWMIAKTVCRILGRARERDYDHEIKKSV